MTVIIYRRNLVRPPEMKLSLTFGFIPRYIKGRTRYNPGEVFSAVLPYISPLSIPRATMPPFALAFITSILLVFVPMSVQSALRPRQSGASGYVLKNNPSCRVNILIFSSSSCFTCPPFELTGYPVDPTTITTSTGVLFCAYPTIPLSGDVTYNCQYDAVRFAAVNHSSLTLMLGSRPQPDYMRARQ